MINDQDEYFGITQDTIALLLHAIYMLATESKAIGIHHNLVRGLFHNKCVCNV
jgi:hypothetical protein